MADGAKDFFPDATRILGEPAHDGRLDEGPPIALIAERGHTAPATDRPCRGGPEPVVGQDLLAVRTRDQRSHVGLFEGSADFKPARALDERLHEALENRALAGDAPRPRAHLAAIGG